MSHGRDQLQYRRYEARFQNEPLTGGTRAALDAPDRRDGRAYAVTPELELAVHVALATGRPLLLRGEPGSGKSSLAAFIARNMRHRYYEHTITSATRAQDLLWRYDTVRRLSDAQVRSPDDPTLRDADYVEPGVLWWAFDQASAARRGVGADDFAPDPLAVDPYHDINVNRGDGAVVLIDEIDKADPDVPNGLLGPLASSSFVVHETGVEVRRRMRSEDEVRKKPLTRLLIVITTNEERDLPLAFIRRCIVHRLEHPDADRLVEIAALHFAHTGPEFDALLRSVADKVVEMRSQAQEMMVRPPSAAEYLDAVRACLALGIRPGDSRSWEVLRRVALSKPGAPDDERSAVRGAGLA